MSDQRPIVDPRWTGPIPEPGVFYQPEDVLCPPRIFADGRTLWAIPTLLGGRLGLSRSPLALSYDDLWCFNSGNAGGLEGTVGAARVRCVRALMEWDGTDEPSGWNKHPATRRYRTDGDPLREYLEGSDEWLRGGR
jgi:hypothetical protein